MQGMTAIGAVANRFTKDVIVQELAFSDALVDSCQVLINHTSSTKVHMSHLRISHLPCGQANSLAARDEGAVGETTEQFVVVRCFSEQDRIVVAFKANAPSIKYDESNGWFFYRHN